MSTELAEAGPVPATRAAVLVVEDEALVRFVLAEGLRDAGFAVTEAANGDEALVLLCAGAPADLMVTDVRMPGQLDGIGLARAARVLRPELKIVVTSAHFAGGPGVLGEVMDGFLAKPYGLDQIVSLGQRLLADD